MMMHHRKESGISCKNCHVAKLCLGGQTKEDELALIDNLITNMASFDKGQHIYLAGNECKNLYAIRNGSCKEYMVDIEGKEYIHNFYFSGDMLGLDAISSKMYAYSAVALEPIHLCVIPVNQLITVLGATKDLPLRLLNIFSSKIKNDNGIRLASSAKQRVADFLLNISARLGRRGCSPYELKLPIAQQDMSNKIGIAFETLSRILHAMQKQDIIQISSRSVQIKDMKKLREISGGWENVI